MDREMLDAVDAFAAAQSDQPTRSEVVRRLIRDRLAELGYLKDGANAE